MAKWALLCTPIPGTQIGLLIFGLLEGSVAKDPYLVGMNLALCAAKFFAPVVVELVGLCFFIAELCSNTIICTELHSQGLMGDWVYQADQEFGKRLRREHPEIFDGYLYLARPIVNQMRRSKLFTRWVNFFAKPWSYEMAYQVEKRSKGELGGKIVMFLGLPLCYITGKLLMLGISPQFAFSGLLLLVTLLFIIRRRMAGYRKDLKETRLANGIGI